jgi:hypothetical protein
MARSGAALDVIARGAPYLLSPQTLYDCLVDVPKLVFPSSALFDWTTTRLAIYYVGADTVYGVVPSHSPDIWIPRRGRRFCQDDLSVVPKIRRITGFIPALVAAVIYGTGLVSIWGCHTSHTLPTRSGPGFKVGLPGSQPAGVASLPAVALTC